MSKVKFLTTFILILAFVFGVLFSSGCKKKVKVVT